MRLVGVPTRGDVAELVNQVGGAAARAARRCGASSRRADGPERCSSASCCAPATGSRTSRASRAPEVAQTPRDLVWQRETARLWRYRSEDAQREGAAADRPQPRQQELHPRPAAREQHGPLPASARGSTSTCSTGTPAGPADAENTLETYVADLHPEARSPPTGADELTLLGYCFGGVLALLTAAGRQDAADPQPRHAHHAVRLPRDRLHVRHVPRGPARRRRRDRRHGLVPAARDGRGLPVDQADRPARAAAEPVGAAVERGPGRELPRHQRLDARPGAVPRRGVPPDRRRC